MMTYLSKLTKAIGVKLPYFVLLTLSCSASDEVITYDFKLANISNIESTFLNIMNQQLVHEVKPDVFACNLMRGHSSYMIEKGVVSHDNYPDRYIWLTERGGHNVSEIVAYGYSIPQTAFEAFMNSDEHKHIFTQYFDLCGISIMADQNNNYYYSIIFIKL